MKVNQVRWDALREVLDDINSESKSLAFVYADRKNSVKTFNVGWCSIGTVGVDSARDMIFKLEDAVSLAEALNKMQIEIDKSEEESKVDSFAKYDNLKSTMKRAIKLRQYEMLECLVGNKAWF